MPLDLYNIVVAGMEPAKEHAVWGTFGKGGMEHCGGTCPEHQLQWKRLVDCDTEHLIAILATQPQLRRHDYWQIIHSILADRGLTQEQVQDAITDRLNQK